MSNPFNDWLGTVLQFILNALQDVVNYLDPFSYVLKAVEMVFGMLPEPADLSTFYETYLLIFEWLVPSFQLINHFINLPVFGLAIGAILFIENAINIFRVWRMLRSFVT